ncbi:MAG: hypothetical protein ACI4SB_00645 [Acutalibacteraceae bacterium]
MKKVISVLLALVMMFSLMNVAFATAEDPAGDTTVAASEEDTLDQIRDIPLWQVKIGVKVASIVLKIVLVFAKLGFIDLSGIIAQLQDFISNATSPAEPEAPATTVAAA